jgi:membrane-associated protein
MAVLYDFVDLFLHLDTHLQGLIDQYGSWVYAILFVVVFCETGLVVTPILPGDSLLFAAGTFAALGSLDVWLLMILLTVAAILGDAVNYACGQIIGPRVFRYQGGWLLNREYLDRTHRFYEKYGAKTIVLARFVPIVRTFAPFVAGVGRMSYRKFAFYNILGAIAWVSICLFGGYAFGNIPLVRRNFSIVVMGIVFVSVLPMVIEYVRPKLQDRSARRKRAATEAALSSGETTAGNVSRD